LNDKFKELGIGKYQKNMNGVFTILMEYGNPKLAKYCRRKCRQVLKKTSIEIEK